MYDLFDNEIVGISIEEICFLAICIPPRSCPQQYSAYSYIINYGNLKCYQANTTSHVPCILGAPIIFFLGKVSLVACDHLLVLFTDITLGLMYHQTPLITCYSSLIPCVGQPCFRRTPYNYYPVLQMFKEKTKADTKCEFLAVISLRTALLKEQRYWSL